MKDELDKYAATLDRNNFDGEEELGISQIAFTARPSIKLKGVAFSSQVKPMFSDTPKMRIAAPAMIPMDIYRNDEMGEYYVTFTIAEIEAIHKEFMRTLSNTNKFNLEHDETKIVPAYILECWLVGENNKADRSYSEFGTLVPTGTLFIVTQITDAAYYNMLLTSGQTGYSIEGYLGLKYSDFLQKTKQEKMNEDLTLPDGEYTQGKNVFTILNGKIIATNVVIAEEKEVETEVVAEILATEVVAGAVKEVEPANEVLKEVEIVAAEAVVALTMEEILVALEPKFQEIYNLISSVQALVTEEVINEDIEDLTAPIVLSTQQRFAAAVNFTRQK